jgi:hypothetical protein
MVIWTGCRRRELTACCCNRLVGSCVCRTLCRFEVLRMAEECAWLAWAWAWAWACAACQKKSSALQRAKRAEAERESPRSVVTHPFESSWGGDKKKKEWDQLKLRRTDQSYAWRRGVQDPQWILGVALSGAKTRPHLNLLRPVEENGCPARR